MNEDKSKSEIIRALPVVGTDRRPTGRRPNCQYFASDGCYRTARSWPPESLSLSEQAGSIDQAFKLPRLKAVALAIKSPGGSPVQAALIARRIRQLAEEKEIPIYAFCEDVAASGGYWLACAAEEIYADPASIVGSIGVISAGFGFVDLLEKVGVERRVHTWRPKGMLDPFVAEKADDIERLRDIQKTYTSNSKTTSVIAGSQVDRQRKRIVQR